MPLTKVSAGVIAANAVVDSFGTQSITGDKLGLTAINANNIVGASITGDKLGLTAINANNIVNATITASQLATSLNLATNNVQVASIQSATGTPAITFAANGQMTLANTPLQLTGGQIKFPSTKIASADGNTLDDYEEGVWNPVVVSGSGTLGSYTSVGNYTKVGRLVSVWGYFNITSSGSAGGEGQVTLPFAAASSTSYRTGCGSGREDNLSGFMIQFYNLAGGTRADLTTTAGNALTWTTGYGYIFSMQYII